MTVQELNQPWCPKSIEELDFIFNMRKLCEDSPICSVFNPLRCIEICADSIYNNKLKNVFAKLYGAYATGNGERIKEICANCGLFYSGWQFVSLEDRIEEYKKGNDYTPFVNDETQKLNFHKIFISIEYTTETFHTAVQNRTVDISPEEIAEKYIDIKRNSSDSVIMVINADFIKEAALTDDYGTLRKYSIIAAIAHELQHVVDMFIFRNYNVLKTQRSDALFNAIKENIFGLDIKSVEYKSILKLSYSLSMSETRARYTQLNKLLKLYSERCPSAIKNQLIGIYGNFKNMVGNNEDGLSKAKVGAILSNPEIDEVTLFTDISEIFSSSMNNMSSSESATIFSVLGYHACRLGFIKDNELSEYLDFETVSDIITGDEKPDINQLKKVCVYFHMLFNEYVLNITKICTEYANQIFTNINEDIMISEQLDIVERVAMLNDKIWAACLV